MSFEFKIQLFLTILEQYKNTTDPATREEGKIMKSSFKVMIVATKRIFTNSAKKF